MNKNIMITLLNARLRLTDCRLRLILDEWEEIKHKRDARGRFAEMSENNTPTKPKYHGDDVTNEYLSVAKPGAGVVSHDAKYNLSSHKQELKTAQLLQSVFGGDISLLTEAKAFGEKTPDCLWREKLWDFKTLTTEKSADSAIRYGLKQIEKNAGGLVLDCQDNNIDFQALDNVIGGRMRRSGRGTIDIIVIHHGNIKYVKRYKK